MKVRLLVLLDALVCQRKKFNNNFSKQKIFLSLHYSNNNIYLLLTVKEIFKFKANNKNVNFPTQFCLGVISNGFGATESREVTLKGNLYDFSVDYKAIDNSDISNIHKYLLVKNNTK